MEEIKDGKYVEIAFEIFVGAGDDQELMDKVSSDEPLRFVANKGQILEPLEAKLMGLACGEKFDFSIPQEEAFGAYDEEAVQEIPKEIFTVEGVFDSERIFIGNTVPMMNELGQRMNGTVLAIEDSIVVMDFNHPLAGEDLRFVGEVLVVRDATAEELAPAQCGCGCSGGCDDDSDCGCSGGCDGCN